MKGEDFVRGAHVEAGDVLGVNNEKLVFVTSPLRR